MTFADVVHNKGVDSHAVKQFVEHLVQLGHPEIRLRSDGEPPIKALMVAVAVEVRNMESKWFRT